MWKSETQTKQEIKFSKKVKTTKRLWGKGKRTNIRKKLQKKLEKIFLKKNQKFKKQKKHQTHAGTAEHLLVRSRTRQHCLAVHCRALQPPRCLPIVRPPQRAAHTTVMPHFHS